MAWLFILAVLLAATGVGLLLWARRRQRAAGLPAGRVTYSDTGAWKRNERSLFSHRHRLTGRPDYLVRRRDRQGEVVIPVEVKSGRAPARPYDAHVLQLAAYCLLVEDQEGCAPPYGIIKYDDRAFEVDYTPALRGRLLDTMAAMRDGLAAGDVDRNHDEAGRCRGCGQREHCDHRLA